MRNYALLRLDLFPPSELPDSCWRETLGVAGLGRSGNLALQPRAHTTVAVAPPPPPPLPRHRSCASGCGFAITWHTTHCCRLCASLPGQHGPMCELMPLPPSSSRRERNLTCGEGSGEGSGEDDGSGAESDAEDEMAAAVPRSTLVLASKDESGEVHRSGEGLQGLLCGRYEGRGTHFRRAGLVLLCATSGDGAEAMLLRLQPKLHFQRWAAPRASPTSTPPRSSICRRESRAAPDTP